jgi:hypothetical protein
MSTITIPVNAQAVPEQQRTQTQVRVAIKCGAKIDSKVVSVTGGQAEAQFDVDGNGPVTIAVGPEATSAADLFNKATPTMTVSPAMIGGGPTYTARPIVITEPIWRLWLIWCRSFTISGYVFGPDGNPVPSAEVTAYNVDWFWWWSSASQVGTAVTDPTGHFTITFEWCCGWLPWYWWELRDWRLNPVLVEKITPVLALKPQLQVSAPQVLPALGFTELNPQPRSAKAVSAQSRIVATPIELNPTTLPALREKLLASLPAVPEFERFCLWPWCPWWPWLDCDPNIIFKVTQSCGGLSNVILQETVWQARDDVPTSLDVTLTANADACTLPPAPGQPEGDCFLFTFACDVPASDIGLTCDATTPNSLSGLAYAGSSDRPFTGSVSLFGQFGTAAQADYYEITYRPRQPCTSPPSTVAFLPVPPAAFQAFQRIYFDATQPYPNQWFYPSFTPQSKTVSGGTSTVTVYESRQFFEQQNTPPPNWGDVMNGRSWTGNVDEIAVIDTNGFFADGAYEFQVVGYTANADGTVTKVGPLAGCGEPGPGGVNNNNDFALYFVNPTEPTETNPDAAITSLTFTVNGVSQTLSACGILTVPKGESITQLTIDFTASDAEGFLDQYDFTLQWGTGSPVTIGATPVSPPPAGSGSLSGAAGTQVGPSYAQAIGQGAARPYWFGGQYTLTIPDATSLFPQSCAYELQLNVYKRNIVDCDQDDYYWQPAYYSFTVLFQ